MARSLWPSQSAVGHKLRVGGLNATGPEITVVGVVGDVQLNWYDPLAHDVIYRPYTQAPRRSAAVLVRTAGDAALLVPDIRRAMWDVDPTVAISGLRGMTVEVAESLGPLRVIGVLMLVFGAIALLLSTVGLYGVVAHSVAGRGQEFSIRLAVGAQSSDLLRLVLREGVRLTAIGLAAGVVLAVGATRVLASQMYGVVALSPVMVAAMGIVLFVAALAAAYIPARRASRSEPLAALRQS
jgi:putative ABC transport system permease protein